MVLLKIVTYVKSKMLTVKQPKNSKADKIESQNLYLIVP